MAVGSKTRQKIVEEFRRTLTGSMLDLAKKFGVSEGDVLEALRGSAAHKMRRDRLGRAIDIAKTWGKGLLVIRNDSAIAKLTCSMADAALRKDRLTIEGNAFRAHIDMRRVSTGYCLEKQGHPSERTSYSVQFFNPRGRNVFKFFLRGDPALFLKACRECCIEPPRGAS